MIPMRIFTVGHSTRSAEEFHRLLAAHGVTALADVRTIPRSRRHPHFSREALDRALAERGVTYRHFAALGGLRAPRRDSPNGGWRDEGFRGYADHMQTPAFVAAIDDLLSCARDRVVAVMCAEAKWWECHRRLIADALVARGVDVRHILAATDATPHELTPFARVDAGHITYPALV